jgi:hypothetical protein
MIRAAKKRKTTAATIGPAIMTTVDSVPSAFGVVNDDIWTPSDEDGYTSGEILGRSVTVAEERPQSVHKLVVGDIPFGAVDDDDADGAVMADGGTVVLYGTVLESDLPLTAAEVVPDRDAEGQSVHKLVVGDIPFGAVDDDDADGAVLVDGDAVVLSVTVLESDLPPTTAEVVPDSGGERLVVDDDADTTLGPPESETVEDGIKLLVVDIFVIRKLEETVGADVKDVAVAEDRGFDNDVDVNDTEPVFVGIIVMIEFAMGLLWKLPPLPGELQFGGA